MDESRITGQCFAARRWLRVVLGSAMILLGWIIAVIGIVAIVDPIGTKMADDGDPFGTPPSRLTSATITSLSILVVVGGVLLVRGGARSSHVPGPGNTRH